MARQAQALNLLVVDDDAEFRASLVLLLEREKHVVVEASDLRSAREHLAAGTFDAVLADEQLPDGRGSELIGDPALPAGTELVLVTGHATVNAAVEALHRGAADYLAKPTDAAVLRATLSRVARVSALRREVEQLRDTLREGGRFGPMIGRSRSMQPVFDMIQRVAPTDASVLIQGESGTGKEVAAQILHDLSGRKSAPLVAVNCGAIPDQLMESELFGHEKGSFTGADRQHRGFFERANGGTLLLDEITEMAPQLQVKLLRVLETRLVQRVGGTSPIETDVRVLAATNRDPAEAIRSGKLREDLFFRLAVFPIHLPPLRDRDGDVELLAQHFLEGHNRTHGTDKLWAPGALPELAQHEWRGNVRELRNSVQRAFILADDLLRAADALNASSHVAEPPAPAGLTIRVGASIADVERTLICATLEHVNGDKPSAARILGISLKTLYNRLSIYDAART